MLSTAPVAIAPGVLLGHKVELRFGVREAVLARPPLAAAWGVWRLAGVDLLAEHQVEQALLHRRAGLRPLGRVAALQVLHARNHGAGDGRADLGLDTHGVRGRQPQDDVCVQGAAVQRTGQRGVRAGQ